MASRFGRKKRRQAREAIDALRALITGTESELAQIHAAYRRDVPMLQQQLRELRNRVADWDAEIKHILGPHSAMRFVMSEVHAPDPMFFNRHQVHQPIVAGPLTLDNQPSITYNIENLRHLLVDGDADLLSMRRMIRVRIVGPGDHSLEDARYAISESMLRKCGLSPSDTREMATFIARELTAFINGGKAKVDRRAK